MKRMYGRPFRRHDAQPVSRWFGARAATSNQFHMASERPPMSRDRAPYSSLHSPTSPNLSSYSSERSAHSNVHTLQGGHQYFTWPGGEELPNVIEDEQKLFVSQRSPNASSRAFELGFRNTRPTLGPPQRVHGASSQELQVDFGPQGAGSILGTPPSSAVWRNQTLAQGRLCEVTPYAVDPLAQALPSLLTQYTQQATPSSATTSSFCQLPTPIPHWKKPYPPDGHGPLLSSTHKDGLLKRPFGVQRGRGLHRPYKGARGRGTWQGRGKGKSRQNRKQVSITCQRYHPTHASISLITESSSCLSMYWLCVAPLEGDHPLKL